MSDFRSTMGSLQWLSTQTRPDISFEVNQLLKRIPRLTVGVVGDLLGANRLVKEVKNNPSEITLRSLGREWELVVFHDAALYNSVGKENEQEADDLCLLQNPNDKKLVYSQRGCVIGFVEKGACSREGSDNKINLLDWRSAMIRRVVASSFAAETHAALEGRSQGRFCQALMLELRLGSKAVPGTDDRVLQSIQKPRFMITDCKSIYDCIRKQGQHVSDKGSIVHIAMLRQICETQGSGEKG